MRHKFIGLTAGVAVAALWGAAPGGAHPHVISVAHQGEGQVIANGQNHPQFVAGVSSEANGPAGSIPIGPAWFGLETAHHGPDAGTPGQADGSYQTTNAVLPSQDVQNPVIR